MQHKGILMVMSGFSGAGKGTIVKKMLEKYPEQYKLSISATTRKPRVGETHGEDYFFLSKEEFIKIVEEDWKNRQNEQIEGKPLSYYLNILGW